MTIGYNAQATAEHYEVTVTATNISSQMSAWLKDSLEEAFNLWFLIEGYAEESLTGSSLDWKDSDIGKSSWVYSAYTPNGRDGNHFWSHAVCQITKLASCVEMAVLWPADSLEGRVAKLEDKLRHPAYQSKETE